MNEFLNYKECSIEDFNSAMSQKNADVTTISDAHLYILYTKFSADALQCFHASKSYATGIGYSSQAKADAFKAELLRRGVKI